MSEYSRKELQLMLNDYAYEATVQAQNQVQHSLDEIKKVKA